MPERNAPLRGRPPSTEPDEIGHLALALFAERGFEATTVDDIADAAGVGRRTVFRYFPSKNDLVWGDFDWVLGRLRAELASRPADEPLMQSLGAAAVASNRYPDAALAELRIRMTLITTVPALQAHSMLRYTHWRGVIAGWAGGRLGLPPTAHVPTTIGFTALGTSTAAFVAWVQDPSLDLEATLREGYALLAGGFSRL